MRRSSKRPCSSRARTLRSRFIANSPAGSRAAESINSAAVSAYLKFPGLLQDTGLSAMPDEKLSVRIEVDTHPPSGATFESRLVTRHFPIAFRAHDLPSCLAGKVHAILARGHTKGRDLFDLAWYLTHPSRPEPNVKLLRNALAQTQWSGVALILRIVEIRSDLKGRDAGLDGRRA